MVGKTKMQVILNPSAIIQIIEYRILAYYGPAFFEKPRKERAIICRQALEFYYRGIKQ